MKMMKKYREKAEMGVKKEEEQTKSEEKEK